MSIRMRYARRGEQGMVTAETAVVLPVLVVVLAVAVWVLAAVSGQLRCADAAGTAVRMAARGESCRVRRLRGPVPHHGHGRHGDEDRGAHDEQAAEGEDQDRR